MPAASLREESPAKGLRHSITLLIRRSGQTTDNRIPTLMPTRNEDKVLCENPVAGRKSTRIDRWKYDAVRKAIISVLSRKGEGTPYSDLPSLVKGRLSTDVRSRIGSVEWYTTTVKLDMEAKGEIRRIKGVQPQRLLRVV